MKSEMSEVLNAIAMMGKTFRKSCQHCNITLAPDPKDMHTNWLVSLALKGWTIIIQGLQAIAVSCAMRWPIF